MAHRALLHRTLYCIAGLFLCACGSESGRRESAPNLTGALALVEAPRTVEPRLSIPTAYRPCSVSAAAAPKLPVVACRTEAEDAAPSPFLLDVARQASRRLRVRADPDALHAAGVVDLIWTADQRIPLERSVSYLRTASRLLDRPAAVLTDLAAALLVRAERNQTPRDLLEAVEVADRAVELDPGSEAARFNLALGLERLGLDSQAQGAWRAFLAMDSTSDWAVEARSRAGRAIAPQEAPVPPSPAADRPTISAYVAARPAAAMFFGWDSALGGWGAAVMAGDTAGAAELLRLASAIGEELERQGGDASLVDAVRAIRAMPGAAGVEAVARAHREYSAGLGAYRAGRNRASARTFERVAATQGAPPQLVAWARYHRAAALVYEGHLAAGGRLLRQILTSTDTIRYPSLAGRAAWALATVSLRSGRYEHAIHAARAAAPLLERSRETENVGAVQTIAADAEQYLPDRTDLYTALLQAITTLRSQRGSAWLHNVLYNAARVAEADRLPRLAVRVQDEGVQVAEAIGEPIWIAEARIARARLLTTAGREREAAEDVSRARAIVDSLEPGTRRDWFEADLRLTEASTVFAVDPARAIRTLDSAAAFFAGQHNQIRLLPVLVARSKAALAGGNGSAAAADLDRALTLLDAQGESLGSFELRGSLADAARQVADGLVMLRIAAGRERQALADLERTRVSLSRTGARPTRRPTSRVVGPAGQIAAEYGLIGDTLLVWTVAGSEVRLQRATIDRAELARTIERVRTALELRAEDPAVLEDLAGLYDLLVRPIQRQLAATGVPLVLITDREIAAVPFAALRDTVDGRYLIEQHPLRFASSLRDDVPRPVPPRAPFATRVVLVADPAFDPGAFPSLSRLPGAMSEVAEVGAAYPNTTVLAGAAATRAGFEAAIRGAGIVHYAGHAVFDDERPDQSLLVLAPGVDGERRGRMTASELERLELGSIGLVVLSACETIRSRSGRAGGFAGLASSFLAAGAGGVVGSLWRVDDQLTKTLMSQFHRAYSRSGSGADALRTAQLRLLQSDVSTLSSPTAWAGFRYAGR